MIGVINLKDLDTNMSLEHNCLPSVSVIADIMPAHNFKCLYNSNGIHVLSLWYCDAIVRWSTLILWHEYSMVCIRENAWMFLGFSLMYHIIYK